MKKQMTFNENTLIHIIFIGYGPLLAIIELQCIQCNIGTSIYGEHKKSILLTWATKPYYRHIDNTNIIWTTFHPA